MDQGLDFDPTPFREASLHYMKNGEYTAYNTLAALFNRYYTDYTPEMQEKYQTMAEKLGLMISGGTDFHAKMKPHISIGTGLGNMKIPYSVLENMKSLRR